MIVFRSESFGVQIACLRSTVAGDVFEKLQIRVNIYLNMYI